MRSTQIQRTSSHHIFYKCFTARVVLFPKAMFFHHTGWKLLFTLSEVNCLQGKQFFDRPGEMVSLHEMKIGFDPPGREIQMKNLLMSRIGATNLSLNKMKRTAFKHGQRLLCCWTLLFFVAVFIESEQSHPDSDLSTAKSTCCLIIKLNHIDHTQTADNL